MPSFSISSRRAAISVIIVCFFAGLSGAQGLYVLDNRQAVAAARAAAQALRSDSAALEETLELAHARMRSTASAQHHTAVASAAGSLEAATEQAEYIVADLRGDDTVVTAPEISSPVPIDQALSGEFSTPDEARKAVGHLEEIQQDIDEVHTRIGDEIDDLEKASAVIAEEQTRADFTHALETLPAHVDAQSELIAAVDANVTDPITIERAKYSATKLEAVLRAAQVADQNDNDSMAELIDSMSASKARLDAHMAALSESHGEWVDAQNHSIEQRNHEILDAHAEQIKKSRAEHVAANLAAVAKRADGWTGQPSGVKGSNGRLAQSSLCEVDFAPGHRLQCAAAASLEAANRKYVKETGRHLSMTDSYRPYAAQVRTRALKPATAARPGTSNHGWGMAVDLDYESARWLTKNGAHFGWVHPTWARAGGSKPEWWHLEYVAVDVGPFTAPEPEGLTELVANVFTPSGDDSDT